MESAEFTQLFIQSLPSWLEFLALALCFGSLISFVFLIPFQSIRTAYNQIRHRLWPLLTAGLLVVIVTSIIDLLMRASEMSGKPFSAVLSVLPTVLFHTHYGTVLIIRLVALVVAIVTLLTLGRRPNSNKPFLVILALMAAIVWTESATGHPSDKGDFTISELMDFLHLLSVMVWGGGLLSLSAVVLPVLIANADRRSLADVAARFSRIAGYAVGVIGVTSIYNAWSYVGSISGVLHAPYGRTVLLKIILFLILVQLGALNRFINLPVLEQEAGQKKSRSMLADIISRMCSRISPARVRDTSVSFKRSVQMEAVLIVIVLLCASILKHETPARHLQKMEHSGQHMMHSAPGSHWEHH